MTGLSAATLLRNMLQQADWLASGLPTVPTALSSWSGFDSI